MSSIRERNRDLILRAASEEFAEKGFAATKTSDIAAKAGLPKPNVYYYFKSKENLYREVLESIVEPLLQASAPFNQAGHPYEVLTAYIRSKIRISRDLPYASKVFASEIMHGAPRYTGAAPATVLPRGSCHKRLRRPTGRASRYGMLAFAAGRHI